MQNTKQTETSVNKRKKWNLNTTNFRFCSRSVNAFIDTNQQQWCVFACVVNNNNNNDRFVLMSISNDTQTLKTYMSKTKFYFHIVDVLHRIVLLMLLSLSRLRCLLSFSFPLYLCFMRLFYFGLCVVFVIVTYRSTDNYAVIEGITSIPVNSCAIRTPTMNKNTCKFQSSRFCLPSLYVNQFGIWHMNHT